ncbi:hypothetical protein EN858_15040 [Mesorhizobium sp. M4B.F.Ca.ET.215.01.1.1]|uniref:hypothetical protein n=1 Tax=unclassified Mesorhizobium TaxID=325217 RepID=UPI001093CFF8|nr:MULTISPECIES: hypothetical protein [unclassified Mesorhizobium]TGQ11235.1 hypothetical protein EN858_15040 [Mesorhizobium sp. M4B.F.Ca.ET.215.01.1.1]TGR04712.1 hypothetical protein EN846_13040 [Mesorhizobium sp. M4B.F.Ca.ET.203.01.1.1]
MQKSAALDFVIASAIGAVLLVIVGFFAQGDGLSFSYWLARTREPWAWCLVGILIGSGLRFLRR